MAKELQTFLARGTQKAMEDFIAAIERLPADKQTWSPNGKARTALDQAAECAILNGATSHTIAIKQFDKDFDFAAYEKNKADVASSGWSSIKAMLEENTAKVIAAISDVADADLGIEVDMPWGKLTLSQIMSYPYWNMAYHEGQTTYIGFLADE